MFVLPTYDRSKEMLRDGEVFSHPDYCKTHSNSRKCEDFYKTVTESGIYICPNGFTVVATDYSLSKNYIYTSFAVTSFYDKKRIKGLGAHTFSEEEAVRLIGLLELHERERLTLKHEDDQETKLTVGVLHEVRKLITDIRKKCDGILHSVDNKKYSQITSCVDSVLASVDIMSIRMDYYELIKNPQSVVTSKKNKIRIPVFKRFDKSRRILIDRARRRRISISIKGPSFFTIFGFNIFDVLPYILIDNAIKYSPDDCEVTIEFFDKYKRVTVTNLGPKVKRENIDRLTEEGFRGTQCKTIQGSGIGLFMFKQIADLHNISYEIFSDERTKITINDIPYSSFSISLDFSRCD